MRSAEDGTDIVGTSHNDFRPGQDVTYPKTVDQYAEALRAGRLVEPPTYVDDPEGSGTKILADGHHRYVASKRTGIPLYPVEAANPSAKKMVDTSYKDWTKTYYGPYEDEPPEWASE